MANAQRDYRYPDPGETVSLALIGQSEVAQIWGEQEESVLTEIDKVLREGAQRTLLDYGSGVGRLAIRYAETFASVTSYEPDATRASEQRSLVATTPLASRIRVIEDIGEAGNDYDAVLCSHVIQHVPHAIAAKVLSDITSRVAPGCPVVLLTTLSPHSEFRYVLNYINDQDRAVEDEVSADEFERALRDPQDGVLPIRFFPYAGLVDELDRLGMDMQAAFGFHGSSGLVGPTTEVTPELLRCRDLALLSRRR